MNPKRKRSCKITPDNCSEYYNVLNLFRKGYSPFRIWINTGIVPERQKQILEQNDYNPFEPYPHDYFIERAPPPEDWGIISDVKILRKAPKLSPKPIDGILLESLMQRARYKSRIKLALRQNAKLKDNILKLIRMSKIKNSKIIRDILGNINYE